MDAVVQSFFADPMYYIGLVFAFLAALATLTFLRGFLSGVPNFFTIAAHAGHQDRHRYHVVRGVTALFGLIVAWEAVRVVAAWLGYGSANSGSLLSLITVYLVVGFILWALFAVKNIIVNK